MPSVLTSTQRVTLPARVAAMRIGAFRVGAVNQHSKALTTTYTTPARPTTAYTIVKS